MQQIQLNTKNKPCEVELELYTNTHQILRVVGFNKENQKYFDRNVIVNRNPTIVRFGCPITPDKMNISVSGGQAKINTSLNKLDCDIQFNPKIIEYTDFVKEFCSNYLKYPPNSFYRSRFRNYCIKHVPSIIGSSGESVTPARIHKTKHYIEVSKAWFNDFTIPMRVFVLCHEFAHIYLNKNPLSEPEADLNGAKLYLSMGFPVIELMYSFTKIFGDNSSTHERARLIFEWLHKSK